MSTSTLKTVTDLLLNLQLLLVLCIDHCKPYPAFQNRLSSRARVDKYKVLSMAPRRIMTMTMTMTTTTTTTTTIGNVNEYDYGNDYDCDCDYDRCNAIDYTRDALKN